MIPRLVALDLPAGPSFVEALRRTWDAGDAAFPLDQRLPPAGKAAALAAMEPAAIIDETGTETVLADGVPVEPGDALVVATSGSTGSPRGVVLTHGAVEAAALATSRRLAVGAGDCWLACLPLAHVGGLSVVTRALVTGTPLVVHPGFDADAVMAAAAEGATLVSLVATALARIDPRRFRAVLLGGSKPPGEVPVPCIVTYGLTESGGGVVYDGRPLDGTDVRVADDGEVLLRGPTLLRAYRDGQVPIDADGWLATGDLGRWGSNGRLEVQGRRGDLIVSGGENVWPEPVEQALRTHPAVADAAVAGRPDPEWGEVVVAWIVPADPASPPTLDALRDHVRVTLPTWCAPRRLVLVEDLPRTAIGKVRRRALPDPTQ